MPVRISNSLTEAQMLYYLDHCTNTTVGEVKYQFYCQTTSNLAGSCTYIPSQYLTNGLDCPVMATTSWLEMVYAETGLSCAINCYYWGYGITTINVPTISIATVSSSVKTTSSSTSSSSLPTTGSGTVVVGGGGAASTPIATYDPIPSALIGNHSSASSTSSAPTIGASNSVSSATNISPNILLVVMLLVSIMALFRRQQ